MIFDNYGNFVNSTLQRYGGDLARNTKFSVMLTFPKSLKINWREKYKVDILAKNVVLPQMSNNVKEIKYKNHILKIPGRTTFEGNFTITFYLDDAHKLKQDFDIWIRNLDKYEISNEPKEIIFKDLYGHLTLNVYDFDEEYIQAYYEIHNVYPVSIGNLDYSSDAQSGIQELTVEFAFTHYDLVVNDSLDLGNILQDAKNLLVDSALDKFSSLIKNEESGLELGSNFKVSIPGVEDFFAKKSGGN